jgi:hypothetical protein
VIWKPCRAGKLDAADDDPVVACRVRREQRALEVGQSAAQ